MNAGCFHYVAIHLHDVSSFTCCNQTFTFIATHLHYVATTLQEVAINFHGVTSFT